MLPFLLLALLVLPQPSRDRSQLLTWPPAVELLIELGEDTAAVSPTSEARRLDDEDPPEARWLQQDGSQRRRSGARRRRRGGLSPDEARGKWLKFPFYTTSTDARLHFACSYQKPSAGACAGGWEESRAAGTSTSSSGSSKCYRYFPDCRYHASAQQYCRWNSGAPGNTTAYLASIGSADENDQLIKMAESNSFWIGLDLHNGVWDDGGDAGSQSYRNWLHGNEPGVGSPNPHSAEGLVMVNYWRPLEQECPCGMDCPDEAKARTMFGWETDVAFSIMVIAEVLVACVFYYVRGFRARRHRRPLPPREAIAQTPFGIKDHRQTYDAFAFSICPGCVDFDTCCLAVFALYARVGYTYAVAGISNFWTPTIVFVLSLGIGLAADLLAFDQLVWDLFCRMWMTSLLWSCYAGWQRFRLRRRLGANPPANECSEDCCIWFCCPLCAAVQEARQTDAADGSYMMCWCCDLVEHHHPQAARHLLGVVSADGTVDVGEVTVGAPVGVAGSAVVMGRPTRTAPTQVAPTAPRPAPDDAAPGNNAALAAKEEGECAASASGVNL